MLRCFSLLPMTRMNLREPGILSSCHRQVRESNAFILFFSNLKQNLSYSLEFESLGGGVTGKTPADGLGFVTTQQMSWGLPASRFPQRPDSILPCQSVHSLSARGDEGMSPKEWDTLATLPSTTGEKKEERKFLQTHDGMPNIRDGRRKIYFEEISRLRKLAPPRIYGQTRVQSYFWMETLVVCDNLQLLSLTFSFALNKV